MTTSGAHLKAATVVGAIHGLETLLQLVQMQGSGYILPAVSIEDTPRFRWRGLMIDVSRHFQPVEVIKRTLDGMAAVKLNVFHWHLSDDQGFRIESKALSQADRNGLRRLVLHPGSGARDRGLCAGSRDSRGAGVRYSGTCAVVDGGLSRAGQRHRCQTTAARTRWSASTASSIR